MQDVFAGENGFGWPPAGPPPTSTTIEPARGDEGGVPIVHYRDTLHFTVNLTGECSAAGGIKSVDLHIGPFDDGQGPGSGGTQITVPMSPTTPDSFFDVFVDALEPSHGLAPISYWITCNDNSMQQIQDGSMFVDPSGQIFNECTGNPIQGATVTLLRDDLPFDGIFGIPALSTHLPGINPLSSLANGAYAWLVEPGFNYKVRAEATGFITQESGALFIPPEVTGLNFFLEPVNGCLVGGEIIPIDATSLLLAGAQSFSWMIPVVLSVIGIGLFVVSRKSKNS